MDSNHIPIGTHNLAGWLLNLEDLLSKRMAFVAFAKNTDDKKRKVDRRQPKKHDNESSTFWREV
jgi:hypothetical protein